MRVAVISFILACIAGLAAFFMVEKGENTKKQPEQAQSQPSVPQTAMGLAPLAPSPAPQAEKSPEAKPAEVPQTQSPAVETKNTPNTGDVAASAPQKAGLAPPPLDPGTPDEVVMVSHPALVLRGQARWDDGYVALAQAFSQLRQQAHRLAAKESGYPVTVFVETDDQGFKYEAELPVERLPAQRPADLPPEMRFGATPEGRAIRFVHRGAYDEIDSTYEAISAYVDVKGVEVKDTLIEEYINMGQDSSDMGIEVHIFVQPTK